MKQELQLTDIQISAIKLIAKETSRDLETVLSLIISTGITFRFGDVSDYRVQNADNLADEIQEECDYRLGLIKENIPGQLVKTFISPIDNCKFDYFISNNILSYRIDGTSNWQDFIPNNRDLSEKQNKEFNQLLEEVKNND